MSKLLLVSLLSLLTFAATALAAEPLVNVDKNGVGIKGHDPVAYFLEAKAVKGSADYPSTYEGVTYHFASAGNKAAFDAEPAKYAPQFGGFCAWAVSNGYTAKINPDAFQIVDGRLLLQYNKRIRNKFAEDTAGNLAKADENWPGIVAEAQ